MLKILLLMIAVLGYSQLYIRKIRFHIAFFPLWFISCSTVVVYLFGIAGFLPAGAMAVAAGGVVSLMYGLAAGIKEKSLQSWKALFSPALIFFVVSLCWVAVMTRGVGLMWWDDITHWYRTASIMSIENTLPRASDILYKTYVPGSAVWIYFVTFFTRFNVHFSLIAQWMISIASCTACFAVIPANAGRKEKCVAIAVIACVMIILGAVTNEAYALMVDGILGYLTLGALLICLTVRKEERHSLVLLPVLCFLGIIKTSGLLMCMIVLLLWVITEKRMDAKTLFKKLLLMVGMPVLMFAIYQVYIKIVYGNISIEYQAFSINRYLSMFRDHGLKEKCDIILNYMQTLFAMAKGKDNVQASWLALLLIAGYHLMQKNEQDKLESKKIWRWSVCTFAIYHLFLLLTYLFSMSDFEANRSTLASFYRYSGTIAIILFGFSIIYLLNRCWSAQDKEKNVKRLCALLACAVITGTSLFSTAYIWGNTNPEDHAWKVVSEFVKQRQDQNDDSYLIIWNPDIKEGVALHDVIFRTLLRSENVTFWSIKDVYKGKVPEEVSQKAGQFDYLATEEDYSNVIHVIREVVNVPEYKPGVSAISRQ